ncbi:hypothetical protein [Natronorubrum texcoconense]|uniref:Uncharacterized protein n=1 Tax=Natronorubrum texcoconense TaxID=1095776 RepID=A0A1G9B932_9EURY|nr:hypothetical protein [Natronorubrum texcoconense]SDK35998.1 hypothetical protein SAMN04515672_2873 [Natronorubrum texcoconense]
MTLPAIGRVDGADPQTVEFPLTATTQRALHEAIGHCYDELAISREACEDGDADLPDDLFAHLEALYVATADESLSQFELTYERAERREQK